jgi:hypothetical protein
MPPPNGSNDGSSAFDDALDEVMADSREAERLADAARKASDDPRAIAKAERTLEKVYETESEARRDKLLKKTLEIDPGCVDALTFTARTFEDPADGLILLQAAVEVGRRRLGPETFEEGLGRFWEIYETRPYMRALFALAETEMDSMGINEGLALYHRLLELSEGDNLGVRYALVGALLASDRVEDARRIAFERFGDEDSAVMLWARTLILLIERDFESAAAMLERARASNEHVETFLLGDLELPDERPAMYRSGSVEEAEVVAADLYLAWRLRPLSLVWLKVGGKPGDDRYFGAYTEPDLQEILDSFDEDDDFDDDFDDDDDEPYLLN